MAKTVEYSLNVFSHHRLVRISTLPPRNGDTSGAGENMRLLRVFRVVRVARLLRDLVRRKGWVELEVTELTNES